MRKNYTSNYKAEAVIELLREALGEIAGRLEVHPNMLGRWKNKAVKEMHTIFEDEKRASRMAGTPPNA